ncbi:alcohol dehydrogenase [Acinetobacter baumannii]|nr:alcohol dehydrogenase [Acinetobacter baumannii]
MMITLAVDNGRQGKVDQLGLECVVGTVAKLAMRQPFVLFKGLTFQKLCLPGAFRPGDHHNKMLRPGLCVVHASLQYL